MRILIVEDEKRLARAIAQIAAENRYMTDVVYDGEDGLDYAVSEIYDVVILDVMLPKLDGFSIVSQMRKKGVMTPVLMLTARDDVSDRVTGLDSGADDYMTKPFSPEELMARIRALSRRRGEVILEEMRYKDIALNLSTHDLSCREKNIRLGFKEFEVLKILMSNQGNIVPKETLITKVWGAESGAEDNNIEAYISFLRKKLYFLGSKAGIGTLRKVGYRLEDSEE